MKSIFTLLLLLVSALCSASEIEITQLETAEGTKFSVLAADVDNPRGAVVMVHDWFGVSPFYRETAQKLSDHGYSVIAVDLYDSESATTHQDAWRLMQALDQGGAAAKVDAALGTLKARGFEAVGIFGFSMGAPIAMRAAMRNSDLVKAAVVFYGDPIPDAEKLKDLGGPVLLVAGSKDGNSVDVAAQFSKAADESGKLAEVFIYPGGQHAFAQPLFNQGATYDAAGGELAWSLALDFFNRRLK